jgi:phage repressor protein C with HTH and peptisase S24 domain
MDTTTDPVRQLIRATLSERQLNMSNVSKKLGKNHAYLHQFLDRGIPGRLPEIVREQLAGILGVPETQLKSGDVRGRLSIPVRVDRPPSHAGDKIPVFGLGKAETAGLFQWNGQTVDHVSRPPQLVGAPEAYAVYVDGSGMEPRYYAGEIIYVHPGKPVTLGAFVVAQVRPESEGEVPRAFIRRLIKRNASKMTFEQFNPPKEVDIKASDILSMRKIVGSAESSGL